MTIKIAVLMDPIESILTYKDSTFAMLLEAQRRNWSIYYIQPGSLYVLDGRAFARVTTLSVKDQSENWFQRGEYFDIGLDDMDAILMRKDPPFNMEYIYSTYALELAQKKGVCVVNNPHSLRNMNEKFSIVNFPDCCTPTLVTKDRGRIHDFISQHGDVVVKPMDAMGGEYLSFHHKIQTRIPLWIRSQIKVHIRSWCRSSFQKSHKEINAFYSLMVNLFLMRMLVCPRKASFVEILQPVLPGTVYR